MPGRAAVAGMRACVRDAAKGRTTLRCSPRMHRCPLGMRAVSEWDLDVHGAGSRARHFDRACAREPIKTARRLVHCVLDCGDLSESLREREDDAGEQSTAHCVVTQLVAVFRLPVAPCAGGVD